MELDEVYPLSQHEASHPFDLETVGYVASQTAEYIKRSSYKSVVLLNEPKRWIDKVKEACTKSCEEADLPFNSMDANVAGSREIFDRLENILLEHLNEKL